MGFGSDVILEHTVTVLSCHMLFNSGFQIISDKLEAWKKNGLLHLRIVHLIISYRLILCLLRWVEIHAGGRGGGARESPAPQLGGSDHVLLMYAFCSCVVEKESKPHSFG